jgi:hypothetical protein
MTIFSVVSRFSVQTPAQIVLKDKQHSITTDSIPTNNGKYIQQASINKLYTTAQQLQNDYSFFDGDLTPTNVLKYFGIAYGHDNKPYLQIKIHPNDSAIYDQNTVTNY